MSNQRVKEALEALRTHQRDEALASGELAQAQADAEELLRSEMARNGGPNRVPAAIALARHAGEFDAEIVAVLADGLNGSLKIEAAEALLRMPRPRPNQQATRSQR